MHSFLEGPAFDRDGNLYVVDLAYGRIFRIAPDGRFALVSEYDGQPNGLKIHQDGRLFVADRQHGILALDPETGSRMQVLGGADGKPFNGINDLHFASNGDLYFTDQGDSGLENPCGRVFRLRADGRTLDRLMDGLAGPNGLVLNREETLLYVAVTRDNAVYSLPLVASNSRVKRAGRFVQLSGSPTGPDGLALDQDGNLAVVHAGFGTVWLFSRFGEPLLRIRSCAGLRTTNVAFGGSDGRTLFITEAEQGAILKVEMPVAGCKMYSHM